MQANPNILIVGAGPTGLTLACALAMQGIKTHIIDKRHNSSDIPRAINISHSTLSVLENLKISKSCWQEGLRPEKLTIYWEQKRLLNISYQYIKSSYSSFFHLEQSRLEHYLAELLEQHGNSVERGVSLETLEQNENGVIVNLKHVNNKREKMGFSYVIGCDGGNSMVRELVGIDVDEEKYNAYFLLIDAEIQHQFRNKNIHYYLTEEGYLMLVPLPNNKYRLIFSIKGDYPGKEKMDLSVDRFQDLLDRRGPGGIVIRQVIWTTSSSFYHKLACNAQNGRIFLAGDALHQFSPVGGVNMNTGIQDAYCLANKFALAKKGNIEVLKSYEAERLVIVSHIRDITRYATGLLTRSRQMSYEEHKYLPLMKNRKFIKYELPQFFSVSCYR